MKELKRIELLSAAKVSAVVSAIWGFIVAILGLAFVAPAATYYTQMAGTGVPTGMMMGLGIASIIVVPIVMAIMGFIGGAVGAFIYNLAAKYVGGIKLDL